MPKAAACCWNRPGGSPRAPTATAACWPPCTSSGALDDIERRGIRHLFYFQVDNPLVDICGREFVGYHLLAGSELSSQVIAKRDPLERVGNVVQVDGRLMVIEYSDLPEEAANRRNADGSLSIWAGSIAVHVIDAGLLRRTASAGTGPFCRPAISFGGRTVGRKHGPVPFRTAVPYRPEESGLRRFRGQSRRAGAAERDQVRAVHFRPDAASPEAIVVEVDPRSAFAPLKNASGAKEDTPESVRAQLSALHRGWLRQAGGEVDDNVPVEISPLYALDAEELRAKCGPARASRSRRISPDGRATRRRLSGDVLHFARVFSRQPPRVPLPTRDYLPPGPSLFSFSNWSEAGRALDMPPAFLSPFSGSFFGFFVTISSRPRWILR